MVGAELDERKQIILRAVVRDYVATAEPVASKTIVHRYHLRVKPATVRNEMAEMSEMGYLLQPHTSAGRIPSDRGYRFYVDRLMYQDLTYPRLKPLSALLPRRAYDELEEILHQVCQLLADLTNYTAVATAPECEEARIHHVYLTLLDSRRILLVILSSSKQVFHRVLETPLPLSSSVLNWLMNWINDHIRYLKVEELRGVLQKLEELPLDQQELARQILQECRDTLLKMGEEDVVVEGTSRFLRQPEFKNLDQLESLLVLLEERRSVLEILQTVTTLPGVTVLIGSENPRGEWHTCSVVATRYSAGEGAYGSIGVIGPTRMEYWFVIPTVRLVARHLSDFLNRLNLS